ncbi:hypothetical protein B0H17DRAFT_955705 [Mycena rosella]|uniref:Uncharacterized protein n=1 Tax=Mycena rosella TaxID=1033263 RepID=A0AAD7CQ13_MYCRO|nr:hypothetical protein B0H17DRAFT_955705 [Mycena rosella]
MSELASLVPPPAALTTTAPNKLLESREDGSDVENEVNVGRRPVLVNSAQSWRKVHRKWRVSAREMGDDDDTLVDLTASMGPSVAKWFPRSLSKLFGGKIKCPFAPSPRRRFDREELLMELLAAEHSDEEPDDGEKEGSGDDYED